MGFIDIILFIVYVLLFTFLANRRVKRMDDPLLGKYFQLAFFVRILAAFLFTFFQLYISRGDSYGIYYDEGQHITGHLLSGNMEAWSNVLFTPSDKIDPAFFGPNVGGEIVFSNENNYMPARITAVLLLPGFKSYLVGNLFFALFAFEGAWRLFKFFYANFPALHREFAFAFLAFPTFIFWSSGISKEAICICCLGYITWAAYNMFILRRQLVWQTIAIIISIFFLTRVKSYIFFSYLPFILFFILMEIKKRLQSTFVNISLNILIPLACVALLIFLVLNPSYIEELAKSEEISSMIVNQQNNFLNQETAGSNFNLGISLIGGGLTKLLAAIPFALTATYIRPFIWEVHSVTSFISSVESLFLLYLLVKHLFSKFAPRIKRAIIPWHLVIYAMGFAFAFGYFVGVSSANFGSLVRYKLPCLPFFVSALAIMYYRKTNKHII